MSSYNNMGVVQQQRIEMVFTPAEAKPEMIGSSNHIASMVGTEFTCELSRAIRSTAMT
jgi:hypothetical protein